MTNILTHIYNKCKQYTNRIFYTCMSNATVPLHYATLFVSVSALNRFVNNKVRNDEPSITLISSNILFKSIVFTYCFFTGTKLLLISPKFTLSEIVHNLLSKRHNILFIDKEILSEIEVLEIEEGIDILDFFIYIGTTLKVMEHLDSKETDTSLTNLSKRGRINSSYVSILSPGTTSESCITNIPYNLLGKTMLDLAYFMGFKPGDKVSVIADFEFYPSIYTILGLLTGITFVSPERDSELSSGQELTDMIMQSSHKPDIVLISSNNFKKLWDTILVKVYSNRVLFFLAKWLLTKWIVNCVIRSEIKKTFGETVKKVHILNEELGYTVLDILKRSKIMFSSSYGFLEQGNFLAFKDPELFKHKNYIYKSGGTILKDNNVTMEESLDVVYLITEENNICSNDVGMFIKNVVNQGERKFLHVYSRRKRYTEKLVSLDSLEKSLKDSWLVRDCLFIRYWSGTQWKYNLYIEIREDLFDSKKISIEQVENTIKHLVEELNKNPGTLISHYGILKLNGMRNVAGRLQYYNT